METDIILLCACVHYRAIKQRGTSSLSQSDPLSEEGYTCSQLSDAGYDTDLLAWSHEHGCPCECGCYDDVDQAHVTDSEDDLGISVHEACDIDLDVWSEHDSGITVHDAYDFDSDF